MPQSQQEKAIHASTKISDKKRKELSDFLVTEMLKRHVPIETIIGGLKKSGVPNRIIKQSFDKNVELLKKRKFQ